jgi:antitoxin (DNA-binding transcriptional repressor) of toxin-antitoxin stability system
MIKLNIHEAKTHLSQYLSRLRPGETILLCKRNKPIAEIRPLPVSTSEPRPIGLAKGLFTVPEAFFEPLYDENLEAFEGKDT